MGVRVGVVVTTVLALASCSHRPVPVAGPSAVPATDPGGAVRARSLQWLQWVQDGEFERVAAEVLLSDSETVFDGVHVQGRDALLANLVREAEEMPDYFIEWTPTRVEVAASGDLAWERGTWVFDPDGEGPAPSGGGIYVSVWAFTDGAWRCPIEAGSTIPPASSP